MKDIAPNQLNYFVGGIKVFFQLAKAGGFIDLGQITDNKLIPAITRGTYKGASSGVMEELYSWLKERGMTFEVQAAETTAKLLQLQLYGSAPAMQTQTAGSVVDEAVTAKLDRWVRLVNRKTSAEIVQNVGKTVTYTLGTDYELNSPLGMIRCKSTGIIVADQSLLVGYTKAVMTALTSMNLLQSSRFTGDLIIQWVAENGAIVEIYIPYVELQPKGDLDMSTEGPLKVGSFSIKVLKDTTAAAGAEWGTLREITAAT